MQTLTKEAHWIADHFRHLSLPIREKCIKAFREGAEEVRNRTVPALTASTSISGGPDGTNQTYALSRLETLPIHSGLVKLIEPGNAGQAIIQLGFITGHEVHPQRAAAMTQHMVLHRWTIAELDYAIALITSDAELMKQISYERTIGLGVFAMARERLEVKAGKLHTHKEALQVAKNLGQPFGPGFKPVKVEGEDETFFMLDLKTLKK